MRLQGKRVCKNEEHKVIWIESTNDKFSIKALYLA